MNAVVATSIKAITAYWLTSGTEGEGDEGGEGVGLKVGEGNEEGVEDGTIVGTGDWVEVGVLKT